MNTIQDVLQAMILYDAGDPARIQHFIKVHSFARIIGTAEGLDDKTLFTLESAAVIHDIGIKKAEAQFGRCDGRCRKSLVRRKRKLYCVPAVCRRIRFSVSAGFVRITIPIIQSGELTTKS